MKQGDIYELYLDPTLGSEQRGRSPAVILSGSGINSLMKTVIIVPLTTKLKHYKDHLVLEPDVVNGLKKFRKHCLFLLEL